MWKLALLLMLAEVSLPAMAAKRVTVDQLEQVLASVHGKSDSKVAQQISGLELTERLSASRLFRLEARLPGAESRRSLVVLADLSSFLDPPAAEIPATAEPDLLTQRKMMAMAVDYATKTIRQLPNFFATRDTIRFEDIPAGQRPDSSYTPYVPLHAVGRLTETVLYRDGKEIVESKTGKQSSQGPEARGLTTSGVFGPILGTVLVDAAGSKLAWSRWEQGANGLRAVFQFEIPKDKSHYEVQFCCVAEESNGVFRQFPAYHGEIAIDPVSGAILRLVLKADMKEADPLVRSDILVEYGPVAIGGKAYICPIKSVSVTRAPMPVPSMQRYRGALLDTDRWAAREHLQTLLNDVVFENYHVFRSESRVVTEDNSESTATPPPPAADDTETTNPPAEDKKPEQAPAPDNHASTAAAEGSGPVATAAPAATAVPAPASGPAVPEFSESPGAGLPDIRPGSVSGDQEKGFTLRVTTRLVDVSVVALDKKGHPITDLQPDDFEVYDNGRRQAVRFFSRTEEASATNSSNAPGPPGSQPDQAVYSNRRADLVEAKPGPEARETSVTILLINPSNLAWADLNYARDQMLGFLRKLPANERVGLYVQSARGFQILVEETANHALLESTLRKWMPNAQDVARAQEMDRRNRQQFDEVLHQQDLQYVNGNTNTPAVTTTMVDPELRDFGSNPARDALAILVRVARHLAAVPGHKNLVWVASNNVLANWEDTAVGTDKGNRQIQDFVLHAQEALNDAQVSVYPLDATQMDTQAVDASLQNNNIQLSPSVTVMPNQGPGSSAETPAQTGGQAPGRVSAQMQRDIRPIQGAIQEMAQATGGRVFRRSGSITSNLNAVVADGQATYLLGFSPDTPADDQFHLLTVKLTGKQDVTLRYRTGYLYSRDLATLKDRFTQAVWQPLDVSEIAVTAKPTPAYTGATIKLNFAINDLALRLQGGRWMDKLDIFIVHRDNDGLHARITERTLALALQPETYQQLLEKGVPFDQFVERTEDSGSIRILVVDGNSGRMGSVTLPAAILQAKPK